MDTLDFKISINKYYDWWNYVILSILLSLLVLGSWKIIPIPPFIGVLGGVIFGITVFTMYFVKIKQKFTILSVTENYLIIESNPLIKIDYINIQNIILRGGAVKSTNWFDFGFGSRSFITIPDTGQENIIKIITKDKKTIVRNVWCENDSDYWRLKSLGDFFTEKGIEVKMKGFKR